MENASSNFILAVPGSDQTRELSRDALLSEVALGKITPDHWVWSAEDADWKQISQIASLQAPAKPTLPPPRLATGPAPISKTVVNPAPVLSSPAPISKVTVNPNPQLTVSPTPISKVTVNPTPQLVVSSAPIPKSGAGSAPVGRTPLVPPADAVQASSIMPMLTPKSAPALPAGKGLPPLAAASASPAKEPPAYGAPTAAPIRKTVAHTAPELPAKKKRVVQPRRDPRVQNDDDGHPYLKFVFGLLCVAVAAVIGANYVLVDEVLDGALDKTSYVLVPTYAHLGSFIQPNALVIHVLPTAELNANNLTAYLQTLARNTPPQPINHEPFRIVTLTSAWMSQYAFAGDDWQTLGKMKDAKPDERRDFITDHLRTTSGQPLIHDVGNLNPADLKTARDQVWQDFTAHLLGKSAS